MTFLGTRPIWTHVSMCFSKSAGHCGSPQTWQSCGSSPRSFESTGRSTRPTCSCSSAAPTSTSRALPSLAPASWSVPRLHSEPARKPPSVFVEGPLGCKSHSPEEDDCGNHLSKASPGSNTVLVALLTLFNSPGSLNTWASLSHFT